MKRNVLGLFLSLLSVLVRITAAASAQSSVTDRDLEGLGKWHILDKHNYSSQIRIHLNIILIVSVSWSGESRSLMREISDLVTVRAEEFGSLELMYLHRNKEKMLADAIGASGEGGVSVFYLHHSEPYKYQGRLRAISILYSISPYLSHEPEEIPLKELKSEHELRTFIDSTDKAVLLMEFCGWTHQLLARDNKNGTHSSGFQFQGDFAGANGETERPPISLGQENQKVAGDEKAMLTCGTESAFSGIPSLGEFRSGNDSSTGQEDESWGAQKENSDAGLSCTYEQFQQFDSSFSKFMAVAREFFLPNEKHRFGLVSEQSLLSSLGIGHPGSWAVMLACNGCQIAARILRHDDDLKTILQSDNSVVTELEDNGEGVDPALLSNKPSVVLFVDRLSDSSEMRRKSREALHQFRDVAFHLQVPDSMRHQNDDRSERSINQKPQKFNVLSSGHPALKLSSSVQRHNLKEKRSIMVINDGKHTVLENVQLDFQGKSLQEILNYVVQKKKEVTLSSVAKEAGFQLLSQDLGIMPDDSLTTEGEIEATRESFKSSELSPITIADNLDKNLALNNEEQSSNVGSPRVEEKSAYLVTPDKPMKLDQLVSDVEVSVTGRMKLQPELYPSFDTSREQLEVGSFHGSFLFSDGNYRLLEALTGDTRIPSLVIIDPVSQQHYVLTANIDFSCSTIESFVNRFLNKTLVSFQQSESEPASSREGPYPPFGNQNFQEVDSIPRVTAHSFHEMVIGFNQSDNESMVGAWNEDVLVLFSNSWCGFCLRMDLVVREVFRAVKGCMNVLNMGSSIRDTVFSCSSEAKFPKIFLMECTLNDCSHILRSMGMRDVYPALLLFPAESKLAIPYQGDATVHKIIEFIVNRGSNSEHRTTENGTLSTVHGEGGKGQKLVKDSSVTTKLAMDANVEPQEVMLKHRAPEKAVTYSETGSHTSRQSNDAAPPQVVVGSILTATEKINSQPFENSQVIVVAADENAGFQGLIYNKPVGWESVRSLDEGLKVLKEAPLSFGGPLVISGMPLTALTSEASKDGEFPEVAPGVYFLNQKATLDEIEAIRSGNQTVSDYWFFLGFSSWTWEQLFHEIAAGSWDVNERDIEYLDWPAR